MVSLVCSRAPRDHMKSLRGPSPSSGILGVTLGGPGGGSGTHPSPTTTHLMACIGAGDWGVRAGAGLWGAWQGAAKRRKRKGNLLQAAAVC